MSINEGEVVAARTAIVEIAGRMLTGETSYIEGSRAILDLCGAARLNHHDHPFVVFVAIESETDTIPVGKSVEQWSAEARMRKQDDWENAEQWAARVAESTCREVVVLLSNALDPFEIGK